MADRKAVQELKSSEKYNKIRQDLVEDYMAFWITKSLLIEDINKRGVNVKYNNGGGQSGYKRNDSVGELNKTNAQMLKLLNELGIKATVADSGDDDEL